MDPRWRESSSESWRGEQGEMVIRVDPWQRKGFWTAIVYEPIEAWMAGAGFSPKLIATSTVHFNTVFEALAWGEAQLGWAPPPPRKKSVWDHLKDGA